MELLLPGYSYVDENWTGRYYGEFEDATGRYYST